MNNTLKNLWFILCVAAIIGVCKLGVANPYTLVGLLGWIALAGVSIFYKDDAMQVFNGWSKRVIGYNLAMPLLWTFFGLSALLFWITK